MQTLGYIILLEPNSQKTAKVLILVRQGKYGRHIKMRKSGADGVHFSDEENFLNESLKEGYKEHLDNLAEGKTIFL